MKKYVAFTVLAAASAATGAALAADLPVRSPPPPIIQAPPPIWTGFYVGINGGYGGGTDNLNLLLQRPQSFAPPFPGATTAATSSARFGGFFAGGQVGYNYQLPNNVVLGIESDMQWSDVKSRGDSFTAITRTNGTAFANQVSAQRGMDWFGTTRARLGYAFGPFMPYITGGLAYGQVGARNASFDGSSPVYSLSSTHVGWALGAGAEYAITPNLSLKTEYQYISLGGASGPAFNAPALPTPAAFGSISTGPFGAHLVRAGLNWRFNAFNSGPVWARF